MIVNKKIKNAKTADFDGVKLKSGLEKIIYKALKEEHIEFQYEGMTFNLSGGVIPKKPFYVRTKTKKFHLEMSPIRPITYTPDFTFTLNGIFVIVEAKGFCNDVYPVKRNLFRKLLESFPTPVMFFEVKSKRELMEALDIVKKEGKLIEKIREYTKSMPAKDLPACNKAIEARDYDLLLELVDSRIARMEKQAQKDSNVCIPENLFKLFGILTDLTNEETI